MAEMDSTYKIVQALKEELEEARFQLDEANETIEAIRTGQVDALVVKDQHSHQLYTLRTADKTYRLFIEKMSEGALTLNKEGIILYSNSTFSLMTGRSFSEVAGKRLISFIHDDDVETFENLFKRYEEGDCKGEVHLSQHGKKLPVQLSFTTLEMEEGTAVSVIVTDLSLQKETQLQLTENNKQLEAINLALETSNNDLQQFASVASHDLQEPLRKIQIFSQMMLERMAGDDPQNLCYIQKIIDSSARMRTLIVDILNYSRLSTNKSSFEKVDMNEIINEIKEDFELQILEKKAVISVEQICSIEANKGQLRQVFHNIISNALKFCRADIRPEIEIRSLRVDEKKIDAQPNRNGKYCIIKIKDNGIGFDEKYLKNIFALFERLNSKDRFEGTGIGLAISKKITEKHNGLISARSTFGEGSEFNVLLPLLQEKE
jgi:PAS domain S-box-containing protein